MTRWLNTPAKRVIREAEVMNVLELMTGRRINDETTTSSTTLKSLKA
jgi:hypothetical protein